MWVGVLLSAVFRRRGPTATPTLFLLDEVAQLDTFPLLERAVTVGRGFGLQVWMFFQDVAQLQKKYPEIWQTLVNNSDVLQTFGIPNQLAARQCAEILAATAHELISLKENEQLVRLAGRSEFKCQRIDYLTDPMFAGRFDKNPLIEPGLHNRA